MKTQCPSCDFIFDIISPEKVQRTNQQNRWYWLCIVGIPAKDIGYTNEEMHEAYKYLFLQKRNERGEICSPMTVQSTSSLTTIEFTEYVEKCRQWAAQNGCVIPDPQEIFDEKP